MPDATPTPTPASPASPASLAGCWTCKARRKKCEGPAPVCNACAALQVTCHYQATRPEWMDGGSKQYNMARILKAQIKDNTHRQRAERSIVAVAAASTSNPGSTTDMSSDRGEWIVFSHAPLPAVVGHVDTPLSEPPTAMSRTESPRAEPVPSSSTSSASASKSNCAFAGNAGLESRPIGRADSNLIMFYLETLFPFLFPFHRPSVLQGGRAWILELVLKSPVVRQAMLCQSSYYLSLAQGTTEYEAAFEMVLAQARDAFHVLRQTLRLIDSDGVTEHMHGAVRTLASIMQLQRFEVALSSFSNCQAHLSACVSLFRQLLDVGLASGGGSACPSLCYETVMQHLGPSSWDSCGKVVQIPSSEQEAFRFSSALLIFDDIIASTVLQEPPQLYELHGSLLSSNATIDLKAAIGCENWIILRIGEIASLDAWKQQCKRAGSLDIVELVQRAMAIKGSIEECLGQAQTRQTTPLSDINPLLDALSATSGVASMAASSSLVTRIWAHAAYLYLSVVVSGWQPANHEVRTHVQQTLEMLSQLVPTTLLRAVCWPLCVAGCLAEPRQHAEFRDLVQHLHPQSLFGTLYRAVDIMEREWWRRSSHLTNEHDFAACFRYQNELILLV